ncbi:MAG: hypothetical protein GF329_08815 [Candidatus Lokiarchaeota archaeon]|nr:hypothetical protein [Candidatus Lokiarchaeota archaeon]
MKKRSIVLIIFILLIIPFIITKVDGVDLNLWGVNLNDSNSYLLKETITNTTGDFVNEFPLQTYKILGVYNYDKDPNEYLDLIMLLSTKKDGKTFKWIEYYYDDFVYNQSEYLYNLTYEIENITILRPLLPILVNESTSQGFNWTKAENEIAESDDFNVTLVFKTLTIKYEIAELYDFVLDSNYTLTGEVIWDKNTGWLISSEIIKNYDSADIYSYKLSIEIFSSSSVFYINWSYVLSGVSIAIGIAGILIALWIIRKSSKHEHQVQNGLVE